VTWDYVASLTGKAPHEIREYTTVTKKLRRVGEFESMLVRQALHANAPTRLVLNHVDYLFGSDDHSRDGRRVQEYLHDIGRSIGRRVDWVGFSPLNVQEIAELVR
jgi:adenylosuccinate synthase